MAYTDKPMEKWSFKELQDWANGHILIGIGNGDYHNSVFRVLDTSMRWHQAQGKKKTKK